MSFLAWWGAGLSTLLAIVKLWEIWRTRFRIDVGCNLTGSPEIGNELFIRNLMGSPVILSYWQLLRLSGRWPFRTETELTSPEEDARDIRIDAHSSLTLTFKDQEHFDWGVNALDGKSIYIRLWIAGRGPVLRRVHG